jgi:SAM-dependent methyltransferase
MATNRETFDAIAATWYGVRHWPLLRRELSALAERWGSGRLLNLGCGAGSDFLPFGASFRMVGLDNSRGMLRQALRHVARHGTEAVLVQGDLTSLPFPEASFDYAVGVACYHHVEGEQARARALAELMRILRPEGEAFISVWNHEQDRFHGLPQEQHVPFRVGALTLKRYYHLFTIGELGLALEGCGFQVMTLGYGTLRDDASREDRRNICALVRRPPQETREPTGSESEGRG